jgi:hypothetical protein
VKAKHTKNLLSVVLAGALALAANGAQAGDFGHYAPGVPNVRDFAVPDPGSYGLVYNYSYTGQPTQ